MTDKQTERLKFRVIPGGLDNKLLLCGLPVSVIKDDHSPLGVDAIACEEDRFLVLTTPTDIHEPQEHPLRVINQAWNAEPLAIGSVEVRPGPPKRFLMIVHDLDRSPTCRPIWILAAMSALKEELHSHPEVKTLALPLFGTRYKSLNVKESLDLLRQAITGGHWHLQRLVLMSPEHEIGHVIELLRKSGH